MTMKIEITVPEDWIKDGGAGAYVDNAMSAFGFFRGAARVSTREEAYGLTEGTSRAVENATLTATELAERDIREAAAKVGLPLNEVLAAEAPKRERGKPSPGRARRTKEEIAEDEAADAAAPAPEPVANISTGEERIDPTTPEDAAQDAADEAAEVEATKTPDLTHDDVRAALKKYLDAYGTPAVMEDGPKVFKMLFGEKAGKVSDIPTDNDSLAKAIAGILEMLEKNPFARTVQL